MSEKEINELAIIYAKLKLTEYEIDQREAPLNGNTQMTKEEVQYLKNAYEFAKTNLQE